MFNHPAAYDTRNNEPDSRILTILRAIEITDARVSNVLVDFQRIESVALVADHREASSLLRGSQARNVNECFLENGGRFTYRDGASQFFSWLPDRRGNRFADPESQIREREQELQQREAQAASVNANISRLSAEEASFIRQIDGFRVRSFLVSNHRKT